VNDLDEKEQTHVRTALRYLRGRMNGWKAVAAALRFSDGGLKAVLSGTSAVSASMALRVARLLNASIDDLLAGRFLPGACPRCGHVPDFTDEPTIAESAPRAPAGGAPALTLIK